MILHLILEKDCCPVFGEELSVVLYLAVPGHVGDNHGNKIRLFGKYYLAV